MMAGSVKTAMSTSEYARLARAPMPRQRDSARTPTAKRIVSVSSGWPRSKSWKAYCSPSGACAAKDTMIRSPSCHLGRAGRRRAAAPRPSPGARPAEQLDLGEPAADDVLAARAADRRATLAVPRSTSTPGDVISRSPSGQSSASPTTVASTRGPTSSADRAPGGLRGAGPRDGLLAVAVTSSHAQSSAVVAGARRRSRPRAGGAPGEQARPRRRGGRRCRTR